MRGRSGRVCQHGAAVRVDAREQPVGTLPVEQHLRQRRDGVGWGEPRRSPDTRGDPRARLAPARRTCLAANSGVRGPSWSRGSCTDVDRPGDKNHHVSPPTKSHWGCCYPASRLELVGASGRATEKWKGPELARAISVSPFSWQTRHPSKKAGRSWRCF